jgi:hypothetical protein
MTGPETPDEAYERLLRETRLGEYIRELQGVLGSYSLYVVSKTELQMLIGQLRELRAHRVSMGREPDDEANAPADMCCCNVCLQGAPARPFVGGCPLHPRPELTDDREVVDAEGRQLTTFSSRDSCGAVETGDLCGGCGSCIRMQAERSGHTVRPLHPPRS